MKQAPEAVLTAEIAVYPDRMDIQCHTRGEDYEAVREALTRVVTELTRIINEGPEKCPYAKP